MDTPTISAFYREQEPEKRLALLKQSEESGEDPRGNAVRREIWEVRYQRITEKGKERYADSFLRFWMTLQFNRNPQKSLFGGEKKARREIQKGLEQLKIPEIREKSPLHEELLYRECLHLVSLYMDLCMRDRAYQNVLFGLMSMSKDRAEEKLKTDIYETGIALAGKIGMEKELDLFVRASREAFRTYFSEDADAFRS